MPDDWNMVTSTFLQPVTPPRKARKTETMTQYTPQTAQEVQFSMQTSIWQIPVTEESTRQPRHATTEIRPLNQINRKEKNGWRCLGKTGTSVLYKLFQDWVMYLIIIFRMLY